jgi:hypothetical protein
MPVYRPAIPPPTIIILIVILYSYFIYKFLRSLRRNI